MADPSAPSVAWALSILALLLCPPAQAMAAAVPAKPAVGTFGFDVPGMNRSIEPGDDFLEYAGGTYLKSLPLPEDRASYGVYDSIVERTHQQLRGLLEEAARMRAPVGAEIRKVGDFYASFLDEAAVEKRGGAPLRPLLARFETVRTKSEWARAVGASLRGFGPSLFTLVISTDPKAPDTYVPALGQSGLGLPARDYYLDEAARHVEAREKYVEHVARLLILGGVPAAEAPRRARNVLAFERQLAEVHWSPEESRDQTRTYNPWSSADFLERAPGFDWRAYLAGAGLASQKRFLVEEPSAFVGTAKAVETTPLATLKDWALFHTTEAAAPVLPSAFVNEQFAFRGTFLSGQPRLPPRWKRGVEATSEALSDGVSQLYVAKYFSPEARTQVLELVRNLSEVMEARLARLDWMAPETREKAREKLTHLRVKMGYPDTWRDDSALRVVRGDAFGNAERAAAYAYDRDLLKLTKPFDPSEWTMAPTTVGAYSNAGKLELGFMAAILQPPFFDPHADPAVNYGGIGAIIGHELTHLFDDQGRKYDPSGRLRDWWTPVDVARFEALTQKLVAQFNGYEPLPGTHVNGQLTLGENIADLGGVTIAYEAYRRSLGGQEAPVLEGFSGDQRFFLGFTQNWRFKYRESNLRQLMLTNHHAPLHYRTYTVRNLDAWYAAFDVRPGQKLYLEPEARVRIW